MLRLWARDFYHVIVDKGTVRVNYRVTEIESVKSNCFSINPQVVQTLI